MVKLNIPEVKEMIKKAVAEDIGVGDVTSQAIIPPSKKIKGKIIAKAFGIIAGLEVAKLVFETADKKIKVKMRVKDGARAFPGRVLVEISGPAGPVLSAERTALNFLQRMSGIATTTMAYVNKVKFRKTKIMATRKTAPGLRILDKYAVEVGGGEPHRMGLYDAILIKENHVDIVGGIKKAISLARRNSPPILPIEIEARTLPEVAEAIGAGANKILLDNMDRFTLGRAVKLVREHNDRQAIPQAKIETEASGGVNLGNVARIARTGVDYISVGALTHSPKALDMSLEIC